MNETYVNPTACHDPVSYHNRVMRRQKRRLDRANRFVFCLFRFSLAFFIWALCTIVLVGMAH